MLSLKVAGKEILDIISEVSDDANPYKDFKSYIIEEIRSDIKNSPDNVFYDSSSALESVRDHVWNRLEHEKRYKHYLEESDLFPTIGELKDLYNKLLKKLLVNPSTKLPYFFVSKIRPDIDGYIEVTIPSTLMWIFSAEAGAFAPKLRVDKNYAIYGINFLKIISASCSGIENLLDFNEISKNPNVIVPRLLLENNNKEESTRSRLRRFAMRAAAPIFMPDIYKDLPQEDGSVISDPDQILSSSGGSKLAPVNYNFSINNIFYHSSALIELIRIPSATTWFWKGMSSGKFMELVYIMALVLDRMGEPVQALYLLERLRVIDEDDDRVDFHQARIFSRLGKFDKALEKLESAIELNPEREYYQTCRAQVMEQLPVPEPYKTQLCPDIRQIYDLITENIIDDGELPIGEHIESCPVCRAWFDMMTKLSKI